MIIHEYVRSWQNMPVFPGNALSDKLLSRTGCVVGLEKLLKSKTSLDFETVFVQGSSFLCNDARASHGTVCSGVLCSGCSVIVVQSQPLCCFSHVDDAQRLILCRLHCSLSCALSRESSQPHQIQL